jgi:hypothetical protein
MSTINIAYKALAHLLVFFHLRAPDQGSTVDFFLFPRMNNLMKGARFADVVAIQERVTAVLRSIPKEAFADSFQKLYERYQQCVVKNGDYFQCQKSSFLCIFCFVCFVVPFTELLDTPRVKYNLVTNQPKI